MPHVFLVVLNRGTRVNVESRGKEGEGNYNRRNIKKC